MYIHEWAHEWPTGRLLFADENKKPKMTDGYGWPLNSELRCCRCYPVLGEVLWFSSVKFELNLGTCMHELGYLQVLAVPMMLQPIFTVPVPAWSPDLIVLEWLPGVTPGMNWDTPNGRTHLAAFSLDSTKRS